MQEEYGTSDEEQKIMEELKKREELEKLPDQEEPESSLGLVSFGRKT